MLTLAARELVKSTAPVLKAHGLALTSHFYARMFTHNPELREVFNQGHQRSGSQQQALAMAVAAYAEHIDEPTVLLGVLERVAHKHVSLGIRKEHYAIVGRHLLASIKEVLGDAATPALLNAWALAYDQLAGLLAGMEQSLYDTTVARAGGWTGWRTFRVLRKQPESEEITSFELVPADGGAVPAYRPGQYLSVRLVVPELGYRQPRQYSLSDAPGKAHLRISVKREPAAAGRPQGMVSNRLHAHVAEGDLVEIAPPAGDFFLHEDRGTPVVLISAGVGITPVMAMLEHLHAQGSARVIRFIHACRHAGVQAFGARLRHLAQSLAQASTWMLHEEDRVHDGKRGADALGRLDLLSLSLPDDADFYLCGPRGFMSAQISALRARGVAGQRIHAEVFGTGGLAA
jgi:nitric oxide dioxygenase